jgi:hypothetical protein
MKLMKMTHVTSSPIAGIPDSVWLNHIVPFLSRAQLTAFGFTLDVCRALGIVPRPLNPAVFTAPNLDRVYRFRSDDINLSWRPRREPTVAVHILDTEKQIVVTMLLGLLRRPEFSMSVITHMDANPIQARVYPPYVHFMSPEVRRYRDSMVQVVPAHAEDVVCRKTVFWELDSPTQFTEYYPLKPRQADGVIVGVVRDVHYAI